MTYQEFLDQATGHLDALGYNPSQVAFKLSQDFNKDPETIAKVLYKQFHCTPTEIAGALMNENGLRLSVVDVIKIFNHVPEFQRIPRRSLVEMLCEYQITDRSYEEVAQALNVTTTLSYEDIAGIFRDPPLSLPLERLIQILRSPEGLGLSADDVLEILAHLDPEYCE